ncbi:hypothetical protein T492DRAFT_1130724, partial [Pavlovales sp. CCMP2436]
HGAAAGLRRAVAHTTRLNALAPAAIRGYHARHMGQQAAEPAISGNGACRVLAALADHTLGGLADAVKCASTMAFLVFVCKEGATEYPMVAWRPGWAHHSTLGLPGGRGRRGLQRIFLFASCWRPGPARLAPVTPVIWVAGALGGWWGGLPILTH